MGRDSLDFYSNLLFGKVGCFMRSCLFRILSIGVTPNHIAFIMDGNRRYAKKLKMEEGAGHDAGFFSLISVLKYCYELGVKYVTVYAFSIDNFKRNPDEVQLLMDQLLEKIGILLEKESVVNHYGIRVYFIGNLKLLSDPVRDAVEKLMKDTADNSRIVLSVCLAYTSRDEIVHAVEESCMHKSDEVRAWTEHTDPEVSRIHSSGIKGIEEREMTVLEEDSIIKLVDVEKHMYMAVAPDPDILIRSSGETRLSNFLLWQTSNCLLFSPEALWPEIGLWHLVQAILNYQRHRIYIEKKKKQF